MTIKAEILMIAFINLSFGNILSYLGSLIFLVYYLSKLKLDVIDVKYKGSWKWFFRNFKNWFKK